MSSAKYLVVEKCMHLRRSLYNISNVYKNSNGHSTDPCGTPCATGIGLEFVLPTYYCLLER